MSDKDIRLVIKAKNEANKAIDSVSDALKELNSQTAKTEKSAKKTDQVLGQLGDEFKRLSNEIAGLGALGKVAGELDRAATALGRLEQEAKGASDDFERVSSEVKKAGEETERLRRRSDELGQAQTNQAAAVKAAREQMRAANKELKDAERAMDRVSKSANKHQAKSPWSNAAASAQAIFNGNLEQARATADQASNTYSKLNAEYRQTKETLSSVTTELRNASKAEGDLRNETERLERAAKAKADALARGRVELAGMEKVAAEAAAKLGGVAINQEKIAAATAEANAALRQTTALQGAMSRYSAGGGLFTDPKSAESIRKQRTEVEKARQAYRILDNEVQRLSTSIRATNGPTSQQAQALREVSAAAREAKTELQRQVDILRQMPGVASQMGGIRGFFQSLYGDSRKAMSMTQRLRGEVLSLATAYLGLYGAIDNIGGVIKSYQRLEAAQNRIGVVVGQNESAIKSELGWLERQASRLGIEFGTLADEYSKFAVAANAANFESENTRKIFLSVAEAARVNKNTTEQMSGIFLALQQMISKGKIQSEELRRQLGDRMAGAFNIFAQALGVTTEQLDDMMKKGEVLASETNLLKFADELNRRFGPQLAESLKTTTTLMGQFSNEIFQAQLRVGEGGFIKAFNEALKEMIDYFRSREGRDFFLSLGAALGTATKAVTFLLRNIDYLIEAIKLLIAFKLGQWALTASKGFTDLIGSLNRSRQALMLYRTAMVTTQSAAVTLTGVIGTLGRVLQRLPAVAVFTAAAYGIEYLLGKWVGGVDDVTRNVDEHKRVMENVLSAYDKAANKAGDWAKAVEGVTLIDAERNFTTQLQAFEEARKALKQKLSGNASGGLTGLLFDSGDTKKVRDLVESFDSKNIDTFLDRLKKVNAEISDVDAKKMLQEVYDLAKAYKESGERAGEAAVIAQQMGSKLSDVEKTVDETGKSLKDLTSATNGSAQAFSNSTSNMDVYKEGLDKLKGYVKDVADEMERMKKLSEIDAEYAKALEGIGNQRGWRAKQDELDQWRDRARESVNSKYYESDYRKMRSTDQGAQMERIIENTVRVAEQLGISSKDLLTVMSYETGGTMNPWQMGQKTKWGRHVGLIQMGEPQREKYGYTEDASIERKFDAIANYLKDAGVKAGTGLLDLYSAINAGGVGLHNRSDEKNGGAPGTVRDKVFNQMGGHKDRANALLKAYDDIVDKAEDHSKELKKQSDERKKQTEATQKQLSDMTFENEQQRLKIAGKEKEAFIEGEIRKAREANKNITPQEIEQVRKLAEERFKLNQELTAEQKKKKEIEQVNARIQQLEEKRASLEQVKALQEERGDMKGVQRTEAAMDRVNIQLMQAIEKAREFWKSMGGPESEIALSRLDALELKLQKTGQKAAFSGAQITEMMAGGLTNAFDRFAQAIANGENAVEALRDAFLQFAADFLIEIGKMIVKQVLLNMLQGLGGIFAGGMNALVAHTGAVVGVSGGSSRSVAPGWFSSALFYHTGGIAGLKPDEVPAILQTGEEVLTEDDPRHRGNGGLSAQRPSVKIVNTFDAGDVVSQGLSSGVGEDTFINVVRSNASTIREALGIS